MRAALRQVLPPPPHHLTPRCPSHPLRPPSPQWRLTPPPLHLPNPPAPGLVLSSEFVNRKCGGGGNRGRLMLTGVATPASATLLLLPGTVRHTARIAPSPSPGRRGHLLPLEIKEQGEEMTGPTTHGGGAAGPGGRGGTQRGARSTGALSHDE